MSVKVPCYAVYAAHCTIELAAELTMRALDIPKLDHGVLALAARLAAFDGLLERIHPHMA